jgi:DNA repair exonuclease SbcCD ATPase subunit
VLPLTKAILEGVIVKHKNKKKEDSILNIFKKNIAKKLPSLHKNSNQEDIKEEYNSVSKKGARDSIHTYDINEIHKITKTINHYDAKELKGATSGENRLEKINTEYNITLMDIIKNKDKSLKDQENSLTKQNEKIKYAKKDLLKADKALAKYREILQKYRERFKEDKEKTKNSDKDYRAEITKLNDKLTKHEHEYKSVVQNNKSLSYLNKEFSNKLTKHEHEYKSVVTIKGKLTTQITEITNDYTSQIKGLIVERDNALYTLKSYKNILGEEKHHIKVRESVRLDTYNFEEHFNDLDSDILGNNL